MTAVKSILILSVITKGYNGYKIYTNVASVHQLSADVNTIRVEGVTMNRDITIYLDCTPRERFEEFAKRFYGCDVNPTNLAKAVWNRYLVGYIAPQGIDGNGKLVLFGFTDIPPFDTIKNYSETFKAIKLGAI